jgi:hypothetical protein
LQYRRYVVRDTRWKDKVDLASRVEE